MELIIFDYNIFFDKWKFKYVINIYTILILLKSGNIIRYNIFAISRLVL